ncbi:MAG: hypothetical protein KF833_22020 [Verrucomicrobiae bacterium]|nr:hypothetical protein [Verrucomicrobiae bacterium]
MGDVPEPPSGPDLWAVIAPACAAAGVGTLATILGALRQINPALRIEFDLVSGLCGMAGAGAGWWLGRGLWRLARTPPGEVPSPVLRRRVILGFAVLGGVTVLAFAVAAWSLPDSRRRDTLSGVLLAVVVLGAIGWVLYRLARLFGSPDDPGPDPE